RRIKPGGRRRSRRLTRETCNESLELSQLPEAFGFAEPFDLRAIGRFDFGLVIVPTSASYDRVKQPRRAKGKRASASMHLVAARVAFDHGQETPLADIASDIIDRGARRIAIAQRLIIHAQGRARNKTGEARQKRGCGIE